MAQHYTSGMSLEDWIEIKTREKEVARSEQVAKGANSKLRHTRAFKGFPLNCYEPIEAVFHEEPYLLSPARGTCIFMQDYESFRIPEDVVVVGMENGENFRYIRAQKYLFDESTLCISLSPIERSMRLVKDDSQPLYSFRRF